MKNRIYKLMGGRLAVSWHALLAAALAVLILSSAVSAATTLAPLTVNRDLPVASLSPGDTFDVTVTFTAPENDFNAIGLTDFAPPGWIVSVNTAWCTPIANAATATGNNTEIAWFGPYDAGTEFTALYKVDVPLGTLPGTYEFTGGFLEYYIAGSGPNTVGITGDYEVTVEGYNLVVSGKPLDSATGEIAGDGWVPPGPPPGFEECDQFHPCEWLWVWGYGFEHCQTYRIWIQPYEEGTSVTEGQELIEDLCPPNFPPTDPTGLDPLPPDWEPGWVEVHIEEDGTFGPVPIWHVEGEYCELWEIVADKMGHYDPDTGEWVPAEGVGIYNPDEDGLDAAATDAWGFHIYPEGLTIILLSLGLAAVGGYLVVRRRKGAETAS